MISLDRTLPDMASGQFPVSAVMSRRRQRRALDRSHFRFIRFPVQRQNPAPQKCPKSQGYKKTRCCKNGELSVVMAGLGETKLSVHWWILPTANMLSLASNLEAERMIDKAIRGRSQENVGPISRYA
jgi:hypothetical protein